MREAIITPETRAVFFDAVGTLIEPRPSAVEAYQIVAEGHSIQVDRPTIAERFSRAFAAEEERDHIAGHRASEAGERDRWRRIVSAVFAGHPSDELFDELWHWFSRPWVWRPEHDVAKVLRELAGRGLTLGIASNFDRRLHAIADALPELAPLHHRVISSEVGWRKPSPMFFAAVVRAAGCDASQIVFVGDRRDLDYDASNNARMRAVLFDPFGQTQNVRRIRRLTDLLDASPS